MTKKKKITIALGATALLIVGTTFFMAQATKAQGISAPSVTTTHNSLITSTAAQTIHDINSLKNMGITFDGSTVAQEPGITKDQATQIARNYAPGYSKTATHVVAEFHLVTDHTFQVFSNAAKQKNPQLAKDGFLSNTPCYIVSFEGIEKPSHSAMGGIQVINHEYNLVIDANSGEVLYGFTYR